MFFEWTYDDKIIGKTVVIRSCEAREHGDNPGCLCHLIGTSVLIGERLQTGDPERTPAYHIVGMNKFVRRREVEIP